MAKDPGNQDQERTTDEDVVGLVGDEEEFDDEDQLDDDDEDQGEGADEM